jgi:uncharacterized protein YjiS (DUF1127 family)
MNPRTAKTPSTLTSMPYLYLGLTDYVQLEREARRARARLIALGLRRAWTAVFGTAKPVASTVADFSRADLLALGVPSKDVRIALFGQSLGNLIASMTQHVAALWQRAAAEAELRGLDDRTLHDMGLSRSDIPAAVAGEVYRGERPSNENAGEAKVQVLKQKEVVAA